jgi:nitrogenase molybdenum-iron protein alpha chain
MCDVHDDYVLKYLKEKFNMPYYIAGMPIGFKETRRWLVGIAKHFNLEEEANKIADYEEKLAKEAIAPLLPKLKGKRVLINGGVMRVGTEAMALADVGLDIIGIRPHHFDDNATGVIEDLADKMPEMHIGVSNQIFELIHQVKTLKPDIVIAHNGTQGHIAKVGVPSIQLYSVEGAFFGYTGFYQILRKLEFGLRNTNYQKRLEKNTKLPYKDWYWKEDTFTFLKEGKEGNS